MLAAVSNMLLTLHRGAREHSVYAFQDWLFGQLATVVPFDAAVYAVGAIGAVETGREDHATLLALHTHHLNGDDPVALRAQISRRVIDANGACRHGQEVSVRASKSGDNGAASHAMDACWTHPVTRTTTIIQLIRRPPTPPFRQREMAMMGALVPHVAFAIKCNRIDHVRRLLSPQSNHHCSAALVDDDGMLHLVESRFSTLLRDGWPGWCGPRLPPELAHGLAQSKNHCVFERGTAFSIVHQDGLHLLLARRACPVDHLTAREQEVASRYAAGASHKQVGDALCIAPATVRAHLRNLYAKLGVSNKNSLAQCLATRPESGDTIHF